MVLGELIRQSGEGDRLCAFLNHSDQLALVTRLEQAALRHSEGVGDYAYAAIERFMNRANDEAWLSIMSAAERFAGLKPLEGEKTDLGAICLNIMLDWALREEEHRLKHDSKAIMPLYDEDYGGSPPCFLHEI
jgi:hypothetical protein